MQLQFVYGNPVKKKKKISKRKLKRSGKVAKKRKKKRAIKKASKRRARKASKRAAKKSASKVAKKVSRRTRRKKRKNPREQISLITKSVVGKTKAGKPKYKKLKKQVVGIRVTPGEVSLARAVSAVSKENARRFPKKSKKAKALRRTSKKWANKAKKMAAHRQFVAGKLANMKGILAGTREEGIKSGPVVTSKRSQLLGMKSKKRKGSKKIKKNPFGGKMDIKSMLGTDVKELGGLAAGGLLYGAVNSAAAKWVRPVHSQLVKIPVVGTALPTLLIGALANYFGERQGIDALKTVGKGLIGASVVGMGVSASQMVPGLKPGAAPVAGLGYEEMYGLPAGMGSDDADFGSDGADFGGVDYTMEGVDYTMEGQMGEDDDMDGVDYTMEGLGEGQMG